MATLNLMEFQAESTPQEANRAMKLAVCSMAKARHCAVVWFADIVGRGLFRQLGYSSIYQYAGLELGFSSSRTGDFLRLVKKLEKLPQLKQDLERGKVGYTKAREIIKVAKPENEKRWLAEARKTTRDGLAKKVKQAKLQAEKQTKKNPEQRLLIPEPVVDVPQAAVRHSVNLEMSTEQLARYEALWEKLYKLGGVPAGSEKIEIILRGLGELVSNSGHDAGVVTAAPVQINVHQCPDCERASIATSRGETPLSRNELERLQCDAKIARDGEPNKASIPPSIKRKVFSRDRHQCQAAGCKNSRFLEVHHKTPRRNGGSNAISNLITLCSGCHQLLHDRGVHRSIPFKHMQNNSGP
jgi:hypothetical protein